MVTTIKVTDETKQLLDMIQARITLARRRKVTLTELIDAMTQLALKHENEILHIENSEPLEKEPDIEPYNMKAKNKSKKVKELDVYTEE